MTAHDMIAQLAERYARLAFDRLAPTGSVELHVSREKLTQLMQIAIEASWNFRDKWTTLEQSDTTQETR